jgi:hypothetical protein
MIWLKTRPCGVVRITGISPLITVSTAATTGSTFMIMPPPPP